jgi:tRNA pseudouridine55 synthase
LLTLEVECSKGTYIRSLAYDLGERLGCGAHLGGLVRLRSGPFRLEESLTLEELAQALEDGSWAQHLFAPDEALLEWRVVIVGQENEQRILQGQGLYMAPAAEVPQPQVPTPQPPAQTDEREEEGVEPRLRAYTVDGRFLAVLRWQVEAGAWHPHKVFQLVPLEEADGLEEAGG